MEQTDKPTPEELRKAQAALNAVNLAYEYFAPERATVPPKTGYFAYVETA
ncbi:hypothetical protein OB2597_09529 [Pseudooceanicola batsensis HTCC2597]|uniref:Uncharacterized protein n=1 Tax=Pseudooceanicola batsensis (strain ATCC BAA-863 / DSM 15984 / KCTC 12145 / HTCC2597) TaxID=252305 RepID=A3TV28_PSEBH|nr:hypothetical protein [Pseudooceanicola batsensis]EAQ04374.1 hypothetical protein OB2597_09529 [Pseudooceanicola batsensis HTCC2597]